MANSIDRREIDRVLQSRRKQREAKACYPCRERKVKCDGNQPCRTCRRRDHPQICVYDIEQPGIRRRQPRRENSTAQTNPNPEFMGRPVPSSSHAPSDHPGTYIYSGDNSIVSFLRHRTHDDASMAQEVSSVLGLQNTYSTYPFMDVGTAEARWRELVRIIPQRMEVLRFFQFYRQLAYPFNPILADLDRFELDLCTYLKAYAGGEFQGDSPSEKWATDRSIGHISLLLATLAAGAQYSDLELPQRSQICLDFARRAFQALRLANFLFRPSCDTIQTLLILGNTIQNNGQSDAAWALLGTTVRLAQTMGMHTERSIAYLPEQMRSKAKSIWFTIVWQDSLLSLCYDRLPIVSVKGWTLESMTNPRQDLSFTDVMHYLCRLGIEITTADRETQEITFYLNMLNNLDDVYQRASPHLRSRENCKSMHHNLEHLTLKMHISLAVSVLTRPALKQSQIRDPPYSVLRERAKTSLLDASRAFLEFQALSVVPLRTWSMVHTALSSTLLLSTWEETRNDPESRDLQQRVIEVFSATGSVGQSGDSAPENGQWLSERHIRTLLTLRNAVRYALDQDTVNGHPDESNVDSETSFPTFELPPGFPEVFDQAGASPVSYLDSIMNIPLFDFSQENGFP
ncbi:phenylacrylic acid decarboxylase [Aspergillus ambiguus]|uniref:Zn(II)2Cys6 transcription factor n=1 Tax=Aspergillus ambiguus TaxID=176160 RepID=UPI003CCD52E1